MVRWKGGGPSGCLLALGMLSVGVMLSAALNFFFSVPAVPHGWIIIGSLFAHGAVLGRVSDRYEVTVAEFTRHQVRLISRAGVRTVKVSRLMGVVVQHSGDTDEGYMRTSLQVIWFGGKEIIDGVHDTTLAPSLSRLLSPSVEVQQVWEKLQDPP